MDVTRHWRDIQDDPGLTGRLLARLRNQPVDYQLTPYLEILAQINQAEQTVRDLDDAALSASAATLRERGRGGATLDAMLVETFALVREIARRVLGQRLFDEQIVGALALHQGKLAELPTGEGKTLAAVPAATLHALGGDGVHVLTFNDYLARRDAAWMGEVYRRLGLSVGCVQSGQHADDRRTAYAADITYLTAKEAGFDHLRDGLVYRSEDRVQRPLHFGIVDEADSILIDEARIPLVLAGHGGESLPDAVQMAALAAQLQAGVDYEVDETRRSTCLTEQGQARAEAALGCGNLEHAHNQLPYTLLNQALHARAILRRDVDYIVRAQRVELVDELTGRVASDRHWPDGLQAAIEAREGLPITRSGIVLGSLTLQHYFALYPGLAGMTATARPSEVELFEHYGLVTVPVPSHCPCIRRDLEDRVFSHREAKLAAVEDEIVHAHAQGQPVLVGTASVAESEELAARLEARGLHCQVLNARTDELEAQIIAEAGAPGALTISTNMAGRGIDICLGGADGAARDHVVAAGGLYVIGLNRHDSRRIDNQLRGRAGRQGDPGLSCCFVSLEDPLVRRHGVAEMIPDKHRARRSESIAHPVVRSRIHWAQRVVDGHNTEIRHTLSRYSGIVEQQRLMLRHLREELLAAPQAVFAQRVPGSHAQLAKALGAPALDAVERQLGLVQLDRAWANHLCVIADLRESLPLLRLGTTQPHTEFLRRADQAFQAMLESFDRELERALDRVTLRGGEVDLDQAELRGPSATWTYLVDDDPFRSALGLDVAGNLGLALGAAMLWPLFLLAGALQRRRQRRQPGPPTT
ncbi:MAG: accessory Sec system translocase SecA2 [Pseudomonadota bacterium]